MTREGPFWDVMEGRAPRPPAAEVLGWELVSIDPDAGTIEVAFTATDQFLNPVGVIQGGFLAAMLDDTMGPALVATLGPGRFAPTADLHVQFLRPARPGRQGRGVPGRRTARRIRPDRGGRHRDGPDPGRTLRPLTGRARRPRRTPPSPADNVRHCPVLAGVEWDCPVRIICGAAGDKEGHRWT